jgi:diguanylate cyclase (GGDEF)-like protein/PAS domain S-box-containing protein
MRRGTLREEVSRGVGRIIALQLIATLFLVLIVSFGAGYYAFKTDLDNKQKVIGARVSAEISTIASSLDALVQSPVLWTALSDTTDPEAFLNPLLQSLNRADSYRIGILDYEGEAFRVPEDFYLTESDYQHITEEFTNSPNFSALKLLMVDKPDTGAHVVMMLPIVSPMSQSIVGFAVGVYSIDRTLRQMQISQNLQVEIGFTPESVAGSDRLFEMSEVSRELVVSPTGSVLFFVRVTESYRSALLVFLLLAAALLLIGYMISRVGNRWATSLAARMLSGFEGLLMLTRQIVKGDLVSLPAPSGSADIAEIQSTLAELLTQQAKSLDELKTAASVFATAGEAILVTDTEGTVIDVNPALLAITGYQRDQLVGKRAGQLYRANQSSRGDDDISTALAKTGSWRGETHFYDAHGAAIPVQLAVSRVTDAEGRERGQVAVFTDIREIKEAEDKLRFLAYRDSMTKLPNFRGFLDILEDRLARDGAHLHPFFLIYIDLDHLKRINDLYGHKKGDDLIQVAATQLSASLPSGHVLCRGSGSKFAAIVNFNSENERQEIQSIIDRSFRVQISLPERESIRTTISAGITAFPEYGDSVMQILQQADAALAEVRHGRAERKIHWFSAELGERIRRRTAIKAALPQAVASGQIVAHYQPEVEIPSGRVVGFEALARWEDPVLGRVVPDEFIPVAEEDHLIDLLTGSIISQVLRELPQLRKRFPGATVAVNVSPKLFAGRRVLNSLLSFALDDDDLLSGLILEITENELTTQVSHFLPQLQTIRGVGVKVAIDDFGKGYSSLSRLSNMPLDKLKIDAAFVAGIHNQVNANIVNVIIALGATLNLTVTAEGVETQDQMLALVAAGCRRAQGWYYARALPLEEVLALESPIKEPVQETVRKPVTQ